MKYLLLNSEYTSMYPSVDYKINGDEKQITLNRLNQRIVEAPNATDAILLNQFGTTNLTTIATNNKNAMKKIKNTIYLTLDGIDTTFSFLSDNKINNLQNQFDTIEANIQSTLDLEEYNRLKTKLGL